ncbi:MAG: hypothetical protein A3F10_03880 [Coxiella sp. RIFCSPHIGHO2_12_FULL_42_15]|nr:MAG: hypothetical protein A3F10_03880 [Coxiella sp. RIFCSPHIGHO2_12_FULL_42_15]
MINILIAGAGQIGSTIAHLLSSLRDYQIFLVDSNLSPVSPYIQKCKHIHLEKQNVTQLKDLQAFVHHHKIHGVVSCLPYFLNKNIADLAHNTHIHYFDLTEDIDVSNYVRKLAENSSSAFVNQCGLAPGFVNIIANDLMRHFDELDSVRIRCGGLPKTSINELKYAFTWSVDGLINEYNRPCPAIEDGQFVFLTPLGNLENIQIDGLNYEAFNTSGGLGSLTESYKGKIKTLNYKSMRYPGHCEKMRFLMQDLKLGKDVETLKRILLKVIPHTTEDVVIMYISVIGNIKNKLERKSFVNKYYGCTIDGIDYSALQLTTACSASTIVNTVMQQPEKYHGHVQQEQFNFSDITNGPFGHYLKDTR